MTEQTPPEPRLWTPDGFRDDDWTLGADADALSSNGKVILPLSIFTALEPQQRADALPRLGVLIAPGEPLDSIVEFLPALKLVALSFPAFSDGRSFSKAALLRTRHGYTGALRATGHILVDQLPHMLRMGFDEFEVVNPVLLKRLQAGKIGGMGIYSQPAVRQESAGERYSWRRRPAGS